MSSPFDFAAHIAQQRRWSEKTFGPGPRLDALLEHLRRELIEVKANPTDVSE